MDECKDGWTEGCLTAVMWLQGRWAQDHPSSFLIGLRVSISSVVPTWGNWLAIHKIEFRTRHMMNLGNPVLPLTALCLLRISDVFPCTVNTAGCCSLACGVYRLNSQRECPASSRTLWNIGYRYTRKNTYEVREQGGGGVSAQLQWYKL